MKKLITTVAVTLACTGLMSAPVFAAEISNTGPGSDNSITEDNSSNCSVNNDNDVNVNNDNSQGADSGNANGSNNTSGGDSTSGDANNSNSNDTNVDVNNSGCCSTCHASTPVTPSTPSNQSDGEVLPASTVVPTELAETGPSLMSTPIVASIVLVGMGAGVLTAAVVLRRTLQK